MLQSRKNLLILTSSTSAAFVLTLLGIMQLTKVVHFHLPLPTVFPTLAIAFPSVALVLFLLPIASSKVFSTRRLFYPAILVGLLVVATLFVGLLAPYLSYVTHAIHEAAWQRLYASKNELVVEKIEQSLKCCGFASLYDRAAPFANPADSVAVNACVLKYAYADSCSEKWEHQSAVVAEWCIVVFGGVLVATVASLLYTIYVYKSKVLEPSACEARHGDRATWSHRTRLPFAGYSTIDRTTPSVSSENSALLGRPATNADAI
ncbi:uncharacterized protein V1516DRAFT_686709 [Lipomyces oligophaga]|uniref:uncharacterized protein n=1 Tax=Lipomyces oligophaga TaxID=45792 RepID=UPI0034CFB7F3